MVIPIVLDAQAACFTERPFSYAFINLKEIENFKVIYKYLHILSNGTELSAERTLVSKSASLNDVGYF